MRSENELNEWIASFYGFPFEHTETIRILIDELRIKHGYDVMDLAEIFIEARSKGSNSQQILSLFMDLARGKEE